MNVIDFNPCCILKYHSQHSRKSRKLHLTCISNRDALQLTSSYASRLLDGSSLTHTYSQLKLNSSVLPLCICIPSKINAINDISILTNFSNWLLNSIHTALKSLSYSLIQYLKIAAENKLSKCTWSSITIGSS